MSLMNLCVYGLSSALLESFFVRECARSAQPLVATSAAELRFGLVGAGASMGAWGQAWPVALERCRCHGASCVHVPIPTHGPADVEGDGSSAAEHYVAQVRLTSTELQQLRDAEQQKEQGGAGADHLSMSCRLVILEEAFLRTASSPQSTIICATPGTVIAGVDQRHSQPSSLRVVSLERARDVVLEGGEEAPQWLAVLDVRHTRHPHRAAGGATESDPLGGEGTAEVAAAMSVCFGSTGEQFAVLHNLPALPPRPPTLTLATKTSGTASPVSQAGTVVSVGSANDSVPPFCECDAVGGDEAAAGSPGPLLFLTLYANDPTRPYDQAAWQAELTAYQSEVVRRHMRQSSDGVPSTTICQVTSVRPIPVEGSSWCPSHLPTPAPLEQQLREVRKKRGTAAAPRGGGQSSHSATSPPASPASSVSTTNSSYTGRHHTHRESSRRSARGTATQPSSAGFLAKGWCVRPLRTIQPVMPQTGCVGSTGSTPLATARTQHAWTCLLNLRELEEFGIEVTVQVPYIADGTVLSLQGNTVLFSGMLQSSTSGTVLLPVYCPAPADAPVGVTSVWMKLYVQYLLVFPLEGCGQRGPLEVVRSLETLTRLTVPTLIGHRGLGKTYTRSPVVAGGGGGGAPLIMKCSENTIPAFQAAHARRCDMIEFDVMLSADRVPVVIHDPLIELMALKREGARASPGQAEYTPVRAAVHKLNYVQLRDLHAQCCKTLGRVFPIKDLLMHHWESLVWWARHAHTKLANGASLSSSRRGGRVRTVESALMREEDFPNGVPSLQEVLEQTPPTLGFNVEVKYPFQPRSDSNLFLQSDAFEVNGFVDAILRVIFQYAESGREITFSSFDPNVCLALAVKQSRYDVFFLSDTKELRDLKDYRSFYVEGAIQFATAQHLAGISMNAGTLLSPEDEAALTSIPDAPLHGSFERGPAVAELFRPDDPQCCPPVVPPSFGAYGRAMVAEMHHRQLRVWTWGGMNSHLYFAYAQATKMHVDGVIGDRMPVCPSAPS